MKINIWKIEFLFYGVKKEEMNFTKDIYNYIISFILNLHPLLLINKRTYKLTKIYLDKLLLIPYNYNRYKLNCNIYLLSDNIDVVKLGIKNGADDFETYNGNNLEILIYLYKNKHL